MRAKLIIKKFGSHVEKSCQLDLDLRETKEGQTKERHNIRKSLINLKFYWQKIHCKK